MPNTGQVPCMSGMLARLDGIPRYFLAHTAIELQ